MLKLLTLSVVGLHNASRQVRVLGLVAIHLRRNQINKCWWPLSKEDPYKNGPQKAL